MIVVEPACEDDSNEIFTWRQDRVTIERSLTTEAVAWEGHKIWFENILKDENRLLLMCCAWQMRFLLASFGRLIYMIR